MTPVLTVLGWAKNWRRAFCHNGKEEKFLFLSKQSKQQHPYKRGNMKSKSKLEIPSRQSRYISHLRLDHYNTTIACTSSFKRSSSMTFTSLTVMSAYSSVSRVTPSALTLCFDTKPSTWNSMSHHSYLPGDYLVEAFQTPSSGDRLVLFKEHRLVLKKAGRRIDHQLLSRHLRQLWPLQLKPINKAQ